MRQFFAIFAVVIFSMAGSACAQEDSFTPAPDNRLAPFDALMGTWEGVTTDPEGTGGDVMRFEWILGGAAVQHTHALSDGSYGGRTIYFFDPSLNEGSGNIIYHYFATAGFHTQGTAWWEGETLHANEAVVGHPTITEVDAIITFNEDGSLTSQSRYLDNGEWVTGHGFHYVRTEGAEMVFPGN